MASVRVALLAPLICVRSSARRPTPRCADFSVYFFLRSRPANLETDRHLASDQHLEILQSPDTQNFWLQRIPCICRGMMPAKNLLFFCVPSRKLPIIKICSMQPHVDNFMSQRKRKIFLLLHLQSEHLLCLNLFPLILFVPIFLPLQLRIVLRLLVAVVLRLLSCSSWAVVAGPMIVVLRSVVFPSGRFGVVVVVVAVMSVVVRIHPKDSQALLSCGR